jgi:poly(hydroxyalkanoate) depolymerase family esterase
MRGISDTIARFAAAAARGSDWAERTPSRLAPLDGFGSNPGALKGFVHIPAGLPAGAPLVVVLHGCTQSAARYNKASGWLELADEQGFALIYPEQQRSNNANGCFNWFEPVDTRRDAGEALSIRQMVAAVVARHAIDPDRIFITGLSAGGAMTVTMLATYPEVFSAGAVIAGLPHGVAAGMVQAFDRMRGHGLPSSDRLESAVRGQSRHSGAWPRLSIWHGAADKTVSAANAEAIGAQWRSLHALPESPTEINQVDGVPHRIWRGPDGTALVEDYRVPGMGHGTPLQTQGAGALGSEAPFMLDVGISSTRRIADFWGLAAIAAQRSTEHASPQAGQGSVTALPARGDARRLFGTRIEPPVRDRPSAFITRVIEDAMRSAGLMK